MLLNRRWSAEAIWRVSGGWLRPCNCTRLVVSGRVRPNRAPSVFTPLYNRHSTLHCTIPWGLSHRNSHRCSEKWNKLWFLFGLEMPRKMCFENIPSFCWLQESLGVKSLRETLWTSGVNRPELSFHVSYCRFCNRIVVATMEVFSNPWYVVDLFSLLYRK